MSVALWQFNDVVFLPFIDNLEVPPFKEAAHLWFAREHYLHQLPDHLLFVALGCGCVPLLQAQLPLPAEQQHEMHLHTHTGTETIQIMERNRQGSFAVRGFNKYSLSMNLPMIKNT